MTNDTIRDLTIAVRQLGDRVTALELDRDMHARRMTNHEDTMERLGAAIDAVITRVNTIERPTDGP